MKRIYFVLCLMLAAHGSLHAQTNYIYCTTNSSLGNQPVLHDNELKIGNSTSSTARARNLLKFGDGSFVQIGEWELDNLLSFKATRYNFTNGNVGIGTTNPSANLEIVGTQPTFILKASTSHHLQIGVAQSAGNFASYALAGDVVFRTLGSRHGMIFNMPSDTPDGKDYIKFGDGANGGWFSIYNNKKVSILGNVGIGTTNPQNKLDVNGTIRAKEIKVQTGWADFVFNDDYCLKPLSEVNSFIKANKHLPEIPSATEVDANEGVNLGEMQVKLLQKIEELTLYLIQQDNTIWELKNKIENLENQ
ncbi:MAG: hypothetical protein LBF08_03695 [Dysgonamonadaceae bacterium]|jgi:hypothetical protein|nr:hypothetical protein [Dysgonamonadaceae bacterium]